MLLGWGDYGWGIRGGPCGLLAVLRDLLCSRVGVEDLRLHFPSGSCSELGEEGRISCSALPPPGSSGRKGTKHRTQVTVRAW